MRLYFSGNNAIFESKIGKISGYSKQCLNTTQTKWKMHKNCAYKFTIYGKLKTLRYLLDKLFGYPAYIYHRAELLLRMDEQWRK